MDEVPVLLQQQPRRPSERRDARVAEALGALVGHVRQPLKQDHEREHAQAAGKPPQEEHGWEQAERDRRREHHEPELRVPAHARRFCLHPVGRRRHVLWREPGECLVRHLVAAGQRVDDAEHLADEPLDGQHPKRPGHERVGVLQRIVGVGVVAQVRAREALEIELQRDGRDRSACDVEPFPPLVAAADRLVIRVVVDRVEGVAEDRVDRGARPEREHTGEPQGDNGGKADYEADTEQHRRPTDHPAVPADHLGLLERHLNALVAAVANLVG